MRVSRTHGTGLAESGQLLTLDGGATAVGGEGCAGEAAESVGFATGSTVLSVELPECGVDSAGTEWNHR